jgi:hypothetical protein
MKLGEGTPPGLLCRDIIARFDRLVRFEERVVGRTGVGAASRE